MENILVTGGLGFIGSHLSEKLIASGYTVKILDCKKDPIFKPNCAVLSGDITNEALVHKALASVDTVFHLAAQVSVVHSVEDPLKTVRNNVDGTVALLKESAKNKLDNFVFVSSSSVYGEPQRLPVDEKHPFNPKSPYAASKLSGEFFAGSFHDLYGLPVSCMRFFNVFGPRQQGEYAGVIQLFINKVREGNPPTIFGDGLQTRDFVYVKDVVDATIKAGEKKLPFEAFNIGSGTQKTVREIAETILAHYKSTLKPVYAPPRLGDPRHTLANIEKAKKLLGWKPEYSFEEGLRKTLEWFDTKKD